MASQSDAEYRLTEHQAEIAMRDRVRRAQERLARHGCARVQNNVPSAEALAQIMPGLRKLAEYDELLKTALCFDDCRRPASLRARDLRHWANWDRPMAARARVNNRRRMA